MHKDILHLLLSYRLANYVLIIGNTLKRKIDITNMAESPAPRRRLESEGGGGKLEDAPPRTNHNPKVTK